MAKGKKSNEMALVPYQRPEVAIVAPSVEQLSEQPWFRSLDDDTKDVVVQEVKGLGSALVTAFRSRLAIGQHLARLQSVLRRGTFVQFLSQFNFNNATAYRYITAYRIAADNLPPTVVEAAAARGIALLGDNPKKPLGMFTDAAKKLPPPKNPSPDEANDWIDELRVVRKQLLKASKGKDTNGDDDRDFMEVHPDVALRELYRSFRIRFRGLPANSRSRANFLHSLVGMMMTEAGLGNQTTFKPAAIPDEFRGNKPGAGRRPKMVA